MTPVLHALVPLLAVLTADPGRMAPARDFARLTLPEAREMSGTGGVFYFVVGGPTFTLNGVTAVGVGETPDGTERAAYLHGENLDLDPGNRVAVAGMLRVVRWPESTVNGVAVPAWVTRPDRLLDNSVCLHPRLHPLLTFIDAE